MKALAFILAVAVLCPLAYADYTVENESIVVGYRNSDYGGGIEEIQLEATLDDLGFSMYEGYDTVSAYVSAGCQLAVNYPGAGFTSAWNTEMVNNGRGYVQLNDWGWSFIGQSWAFSGTNIFDVLDVDQSHEVTTFPNEIPESWTTKGFFTYGWYGCLEYSTEGSLPNLGRCDHPEGPIYDRVITVKDNGPGRGVLWGLIAYGEEAHENDIDLFENAIIYAAQPPQADAGGPYEGACGVEITLDASDSDDNGTIEEYEWDIDGDGTYDESTGDDTYDYEWTSPYTGDIYVRCTDDLDCRSYSPAEADITATGHFALLSPADGEVIDVWPSRCASEGTAKAIAGAVKVAVSEEGFEPDAARTQDSADVDVTFTWEEPENADEYELLVDDNADFSSPEVDVTDIADETYTHTFTVTPDTPAQYWRIIASNSYGETDCDVDFSFSFNYNDAGIEPTSLGSIKARFNQ
jgi:hypothetical protein